MQDNFLFGMKFSVLEQTPVFHQVKTFIFINNKQTEVIFYICLFCSKHFEELNVPGFKLPDLFILDLTVVHKRQNHRLNINTELLSLQPTCSPTAYKSTNEYMHMWKK